MGRHGPWLSPLWVVLLVLVSQVYGQSSQVNSQGVVSSDDKITPDGTPAPKILAKYINPPPAPPACVEGACLNTKNALQCQSREECTASTETCRLCWTPLTDTVPKVGLVQYHDTHLYRFALCDGQTPFRVYLTTVLGNADLLIWNQPDLSLAPNVTSIESLAITASVDIRPNLGIRVYTFGVTGNALFGSSYSIWVETQPVPLTRGISYAHSVNDGCSQYYYWTNEYPRGDTTSPTTFGAGHAFEGSIPDQIMTSVETKGSFISAAARFNIYANYGSLRRPELETMAANNTQGLVGSSLPGRGMGYTVNGQRRLYGYPSVNEFTMPYLHNPNWQFGTYYTAVQLVQVSSICRLYSFINV